MPQPEQQQRIVINLSIRVPKAHAAGAAAANRNQPAYSGAQGAVVRSGRGQSVHTHILGCTGCCRGCRCSGPESTSDFCRRGAAMGGATANRSEPAVASAQGAAVGAGPAIQNGLTRSGLAGGAADSVTARTTFKNYRICSVRSGTATTPTPGRFLAGWRVTRGHLPVGERFPRFMAPPQPLAGMTTGTTSSIKMATSS